MKGLLVAILSIVVTSPTVMARKAPEPILARVTVYWASGGCGSDRYTRQHKCATGMRLRDGHCAVDPARIPYGSSIILPDGTQLAAVDTGTAVRNRKAARLLGKTPSERNAVVIDRFFETKLQALAWANSHPHFIPVRVITPGSPQPPGWAKVTQPLRSLFGGKTDPDEQNAMASPGLLKLPKIM
jgi:3D (Asp-Asp-Asp) domain-containing protein